MSKLDLEGLMAIARQKPSDAIKDYEDPTITLVNAFIHAKGIVGSAKPIPAKIIYDDFKMFTKQRLAKNTFFGLFKRFFESKRVLGLTCYLINATSMGLAPEYSVYKDPRFSKKAKKLKESKYVGVYPDPAGGFMARLRTETGFRSIGHYYDEKEAAKAHDKAARLTFGDLAVLNFED